jgi:hypothetical protein
MKEKQRTGIAMRSRTLSINAVTPLTGQPEHQLDLRAVSHHLVNFTLVVEGHTVYPELPGLADVGRGLARVGIDNSRGAYTLKKKRERKKTEGKRFQKENEND